MNDWIESAIKLHPLVRGIQESCNLQDYALALDKVHEAFAALDDLEFWLRIKLMEK